jgi:hypothetical protein
MQSPFLTKWPSRQPRLRQNRRRRDRTAAVLFSMTASCKRHGIDPFRDLAGVRRRLPTTPGDRMMELLPDVWFVTHPQAARKRAA